MKQKLVVSHMGAGHLLVYQPSTGGGLNLTAEEAIELIELLSSYVTRPRDMTEEECRQMCQEQLLASLRAVPAWEPLPEHIPRICLAAAEEIEKLRREK